MGDNYWNSVLGRRRVNCWSSGRPRPVSRTVEETTVRETYRGPDLHQPIHTKSSQAVSRTVMCYTGREAVREHPSINRFTTLRLISRSVVHTTARISFQGHDDFKAYGSEVQINVTPEDNSPRDTRSLAREAILQDYPPQAKEGGSSSDNGENLGSKSDATYASQSADDLGCSPESEGGSQDDTSTSPPVANTETETEAREEAVNREDEEEITDDDTMVMYVNAQEPNPALRPQLISCYRSMWTVNRCKEFFENAIVNKTGGFKNREIMPETSVVVADIKVFPDIYRIF
uniref:Integrase core domain containing protein n=1 Tax=Solanum tuberosum TaxID=4113 RepID=M1D9X6_SOLTU